MDYFKRAKEFRTKKRLGQNFLIDANVLEKIIEEADLSQDDVVLEIGPGAGFLTELLAQKVKKVIAIDIDPEAVEVVKELKYSNIEVIEQDILKTDISSLVDQKIKVIANIPYYITSPIIAHLLGEIDSKESKNRQCISEIILMVQYEVAKRITANEKSPSKEYGPLSIISNYWCDTKFIQKVPSPCFYPSPKVHSALVKLTVKQTPSVELNNPKLYRRVVKACFATRRKNIKNALKNGGFGQKTIDFALQKSQISPEIRGEKLSLQQFKILTDAIEEAQNA